MFVRNRILLAIFLTSFFALPAIAEINEQRDESSTESTPGKGDSTENNNSPVRKFHDVLNDLLTEFGYDVKSNQVPGLKNLAIRKVRVSEALPKSYENYINLLTSEKIRENSDIRLINCIPCKAKTSNIDEGKLKISSPETNLEQLKLAATQMGIENFMDIVLVYHTTHMVLAYQIFNIDSGEMLWARAYNSETIRSRFQKLAIDYKQVARSRGTDEYKPDYKYLVGVGGGSIPNVAGDDQDNSALNISIRATEKFNNRVSEFGLFVNYAVTMATLSSDYPVDQEGTSTTNDSATVETVTATTPKPFSGLIGLYAVYAHNFLGMIESYDTIRQGFSGGVGGVLASGYIAPAIRGSWDVYFGRNFATSISANYIFDSEILLDGEKIKTSGGGSADISFLYNM